MPIPVCLNRLAGAVVLALAMMLLATSVARANATTSTNWSGYAVHGSGAKFRSVSGEWRQPTASCSSSATDSSFWVGIGGYRKTSDALEQVGTELDCNAKGSATSSAWYELVPAGSRAIRMTIAAGNLIRASVTVNNGKVTVALDDVTTHRSFSRTIIDRTLDVTSAEWIAEAPSECAGSTSDCAVLPLADFGTARFLSTSATTTSGVTHSLVDTPWTRTKITMGAAFITEATSGDGMVKTAATATPSSPTSSGAFDITYAATSTTTTAPTIGGTPPTSGPGGSGGAGPGQRSSLSRRSSGGGPLQAGG